MWDIGIIIHLLRFYRQDIATPVHFDIGAGASPACPAAAGSMFMVRRPSYMFKLPHSRISAYFRGVDH